MQAVAARLHQLEWAGVALRGDGRPARGRAYCFLPLPVATGLPAHLNAAFALTSNRRDLWRAGDDLEGTGEDSPGR